MKSQVNKEHYDFNKYVDKQRWMSYYYQISLIEKLEHIVKTPFERLTYTKAIEILKKHPDPLFKYKEIFTSILPNKTLLDITPASPGEFKYSDESGQPLPFSSLSSGEQEVIKVLFDVARKDIRHSVIIIDEPELILPSIDRHPVKRVKFATEVNHEQTGKVGQVTEALFAAIQGRGLGSG